MTGFSRNEEARLAALRGLDILDSEADPAFDAIVREAAEALGTPVALVSLVDANRQWFKAKFGIDESETPRSVSFCSHAIGSDGPMVVPDARDDRRFADNPLVTGDPNIRFYAGMPLTTPSGWRIGTLCVIDDKPREGLSGDEAATLGALADRVMALIAEREKGTASRR